MTTPGFAGRRQLVKLATAAAATLWLPGCAARRPAFTADPFGLGIASGAPTHDSVVLWTRLLSDAFAAGQEHAPLTVRWEIAHDERFSAIARSGQAQALPELAHSVHVEAGGLAPDRWYFYRFMAGDAHSPVGRTRTFPAPEAQAARLRVAYASCQHWEHGYFSAYRHMRADQPDVVMFLGDYIYEYPSAARPGRPGQGNWVISLDDYRRRYALYKSDPDLRAMHAACPWLVTWDDHEVQNDYAGPQRGEGGPVVADFAARRAAAYQAYYEHMPVRAATLTQAIGGINRGAEMRIYSQVHFGRLASLTLLDGRQYRDVQACTRAGRAGLDTVNPDTCAIWNDPARTMLGAQQERWLDESFSQGGARWNVVGQQTLFGQRDLKPGPGQVLLNDGWDGYPAARRRFTDALRRHAVANPVLLGGDVHENWVGHVKADYADPASPAVGVEFCGTSISSREFGQTRPAEWLAENPHYVFADARRRGYGIVEFTPGQLTTSLRVVSDVTRQDAGVETLKRFVVQAGRPVVEVL